ncbi:MAG: hypothetical protein AABX96_01685 [Nanoarchaeota archaeon]
MKKLLLFVIVCLFFINFVSADILYLNSTATSGVCPATSRKLSPSIGGANLFTWPGEFDNGRPGTADAGQFRPGSANVANTTLSTQIANAGQTSRNSASFGQGWLYDVNLTSYTIQQGNFTFNLSLMGGQGSTALSERLFARASIVTCSGGNFVFVKDLFGTNCVGGTCSGGQNGWRANEGNRFTHPAVSANSQISVNVSSNSSHTFSEGQRLFVEIGFGDGESTTDRTIGLRYNNLTTSIITPLFVAPDLTRPNVTTLIPLSGTNSSLQLIEIGANVSDNIAVSSVFANINLPNGTINMLTLSSTGGAKYNNSFSIPLLLGRYNITIVANDTSNNVNSTEQTYFNLIDIVSPSYSSIIISPNSPTIYDSGASYQFNVTWNDTFGISLAFVSFEGFNYTMSANGIVYNRTFVDLSAGNYSYYFWANDTSGNVNITSLFTYSILNASGNVSLLLNGTGQNQTAIFGTLTNASASTLFGNITLFRNGVDVTNFNNQFVSLGTGNYNYTALSYGDQNHSSASLTHWAHIIQSSSLMNLTINGSSSNISLIAGNSVNISGSLINGDSSGRLLLFVNNSLINNGTLIVSNVTNFTNVGLYNVSLFYEGSQNYTISSNTFFVNVIFADAEYPLFNSFVSSPVNGSAYVNGLVYRFNSTITSTNGTAGLEFNGINYSTGFTGSMFNVTLRNLGAGSYSYYWWGYGNGTSNLYNKSSLFSYSVVKADPNLSLLLNSTGGNITFVFGGGVNASVFSLSSFELYRNGLNVTSENNAFVLLGVGYYNYTAFTLTNQNYSFSSLTYFVNVTLASITLNLSLNGVDSNLSVQYPQQVNVTAVSSAGTIALFRDGTDVTLSNGLNVTLGSGFYQYFVNATGNQNYTSNSTGLSFYLNVTKGLSSVATFVNNSRSNITVFQGTSIYLNSSLISGESVISLYNNGSLINQGNSLSNLTNFSQIGLFNITTIYIETQNYTSSFETWFVNVVVAPDVISPNISIIYPLNNTNYSSIQTVLNYTVSDLNLQSCWYSTNNGLVNVSVSCGANVTGLNSGQGVSNWRVYANDSAGNVGFSAVIFAVDSIIPEIQFVSPTPVSGVVISSSSFTVNVTASDNNLANITIYLYNSTSLINQTTSLVSPAFVNYSSLNEGIYFFNSSAYDYFGNLNNTETRNITLDFTAPWVSIISPQNISYFNNNSILINISSTGASNVWFFNGSGNETYSSPIYRSFGIGTQTVFVYANDSAGNVNSSSVTFGVNTIALTCEIGGPYQHGALLLIDGNLILNNVGLNGSLINSTVSNSVLGVVRSDILTTSLIGTYHHELSNLSVGSYVLNVSSTYSGFNITCIDSFAVGSPGNIVLDKIASVYSINSSSIGYNVSLRMINAGGSSVLNSNITDLDYGSLIAVGNLSSGSEFLTSYVKYFTRQNSTYYITLTSSLATGIDSFSNSVIFSNSTSINVSVPGITETTFLLILKNIQYMSQTSLNVTFNVSSTVYNAGEDLLNVVFTDTDINSTSYLFNLSSGSSLFFANSVIVSKAASNTVHTFAQGLAVVNSLSFYSNVPSVSIPGYGGPADTIVYAPASVSASTSFDSIIEIINQNIDIGQNFLADYWITNEAETINYTSGQQTIYVPALGSVNLTATLTSPSSAGTYRLRALVSYVGGPDMAFDSFEVVSSGETGGSGGGGSSGGGGGSRIGSSVSGNIIVTPPGVVCLSPYIRYGQDCCLDTNGNNICDDDEIPDTFVDRNPTITGFTAVTDIILRRLTFSFVLLIVSIILLIVTYWYFAKGPFKNTKGLLSYLRGLDVYADNGMKLGRVYEVMIVDNRIYGLMVVVDSKAPINVPKVMIRYEFVQSIHDVVVVNSRIYEAPQFSQSG